MVEGPSETAAPGPLSRPAERSAIGLLGGSFDPPHRGHLLAARTALRRLKLARVMLIPAGRPPHKPLAALAPARDRLAMVRLAVRGRAHLSVADLEVRRRGPSYTIATVAALHRRYRGRPLVFVAGADAVRALRTWRRWRELLGRIRFAVVGRPGIRLSALPGYRERFVLLPVPGLRLSSRRIRAALRRGVRRPPGLDPAVAAYIRRRGLYGVRR